MKKQKDKKPAAHGQGYISERVSELKQGAAPGEGQALEPGDCRRSLFPVIVFAAVLFLGLGVYYLYGYHWTEWSHQRTETRLAERYLQELEKWSRTLSDETYQEAEQGAAPGESVSDPEGWQLSVYDEYWMEDDERLSADSWREELESLWYLAEGLDFTPDYGEGVVLGVLEIPAAGLCRPVYAGDWDVLEKDMEQWMVTLSRPDYIPGRTHLCIRCRSLSSTGGLGFSGLSGLTVGEGFSMTCESGRYEYRVTNIFAVSEETAAEWYVDDFYLPWTMCYLITGGARGENILVEGTLERVTPVQG